MAERESSPAVDDFTEKLNGVSTRSSGSRSKSRASATSSRSSIRGSPADHLVVRHDQYARRHRNPTEIYRIGRSRQSLEERESSPAVDDFTRKLNGVSTRSSGSRWKSSASVTSSRSSIRGSPADYLVVRRDQYAGRHRNPRETYRIGRSRQSLEEQRKGRSGGSGSREKANVGPVLSREKREAIRFSMVRRKKDFECMERVHGRLINVLDGLELHIGVFSGREQRRIVDFIYELQEKGRNHKLRERTYSEPRKWMRGKGRVTIQFGCCYNYAVDKYGNPPGIIRDEEVDPIPPLLNAMIKRMVEWHVLPPTCIPNSCIVNMYDEGDCIPPHIDHHDFVRPFCTVSFLSECNILFGKELRILGPGEFLGSTSIPLPVGSVLLLNGNGADVAKHCVPAVPAKRISITFRKMYDSKLPLKFSSDPNLQNLRPYPSDDLQFRFSKHGTKKKREELGQTA